MSNKYKLIPVAFLVITLFFPSFSSAFSQASSQIENYKPIFKTAIDKLGKSYVVIRSYSLEGEDSFLVVDPDTLKTSTKNFDELVFQKNSVAKSEYFKLLEKYNSSPFNIANYGLTNISNSKGVYLTIDMCPSKKPFEKEFFEKLITISKKNNQPTPIAIAISGLWIINHEEEFKWIIAHKKYLEINWINHSFSHPYNPDVSNESNFLLSPNINIDDEIFFTEKLLIEAGQIPSIFFRFPGLISDKNLINKLNKYGLIPIGSDAWLAKGEVPKDGSIILVHGNSNEHIGILMTMKILDEEKMQLKLSKIIK